MGSDAPGMTAPKKRARPSRSAPKPDLAGPSEPTGDKAETLYRVVLHDSKEIPPNGQMIGINGKQYFMLPGQVYRVPRAVLEVLNHSVHGVPDINEQLQVVGVRQVPRLPYTLHPE